MVLSMAWADMLRYTTYFLLLLISIIWGNTIMGIIAIFILNIFLIQIIIYMIPLNLNWSLNLYGHVLNQILLSAIIVIFSFAFIYHNLTVKVNNEISTSFVDAINLSISMFCCLGYGEITLTKYKIVSTLQCVIGISYLPIIATYIWFYVQCNLFDQKKK